MIIGIGVDICDINRFSDVARRASPLYYERLLSQTEYQYYQKLQNTEDRARWLAGTFASKEAVLKAAGTGIDGRYPLNTICTVDSLGQNRHVRLYGSLLQRLGEDVQCHLSTVYSKNVAIASAILEK